MTPDDTVTVTTRGPAVGDGLAPALDEPEHAAQSKGMESITATKREETTMA